MVVHGSAKALGRVLRFQTHYFEFLDIIDNADIKIRSVNRLFRIADDGR
jgi:hypothetical protein